jgi:hypothetical protein
MDQQHGQFVPLGAAKFYVFAAEISDVQGLEQRVDSGFEMICSTRGFFRQVRPSLFLHATSCVEVQGGHFGQFIHSSGGSNLQTMHQITYIRTTYFFLHCGVETHSVGLAVYFSCTRYITPMHCCETGRQNSCTFYRISCSLSVRHKKYATK